MNIQTLGIDIAKFRDLDRRIGLFDKEDRSHLPRERGMSAHCQDQGRRPEDRHGNRRCNSATGQSSRMVGTSPPGLVSSRDSSPAAIARCRWASRSAGTNTCAVCSVHGARAVVRTAPRKTDLNNQAAAWAAWITKEISAAPTKRAVDLATV
jgi:hypothetical protein